MHLILLGLNLAKIRSIDGFWTGFYEDRRSLRDSSLGDPERHRFSLEVRLSVRGERLTGTAVYSETGGEQSYEELLAETGANLRKGERANLRETVSRYPGTVLRTRLPAEGDLRGTVRGRILEWTKVDRGQQTYTYLFPGHDPQVTRIGPVTTRYRGTLSEDGRAISGIWEIWMPEPFGLWRKPGSGGIFELGRP